MLPLAMKRLLPLLALPLALASCARGPAADANGPVVIRFWNGFTGPDGEAMQGIVDRFNAEQAKTRAAAIQRKDPIPETVEVHMERIPWGTFYDKLTLSLAFGGAPDLFVLHTGRFPEYASHNVLSPLDGDLKAAGITPSLYPAQTWRAAGWEGRQYALPLDVHPMTLYWNKDLFAKAGIERPPRDYEEFLAAARKMTVDTNGDGKPDQWGFAFTNLASNSTLFMNQFGTEMLTPDLGRSALGERGSREAYARMLDLIYREKVAPKPEGQDAWLSFRNGKVGMVMEGVYMNADLEKTEGLHYGGADVPQFGPKPAVWAGSHLLVLPRDAKPRQRAAAWTFARYASEHSVEWAKGGQVPARSDVRDTPAFRALSVQATVASQLDRIVYEPASVSLNLVATYRDSMIEKILNRIGNEDEAIATAERRTNAVLTRQRSAQ